MKPIFLSLGSNYSLSYAYTALLQLVRPNLAALAQAGREIEQLFGGRPVFYYKGRDAIEQALLAIQRKHTQKLTVFTQAASCYAIEEAITRAGAQPVYVDVGKHKLNMTVKTLEATYVQSGRPRNAVVIVQHLLGYPADMVRLQEWCQQNSVLLIEDVAQSFGALSSESAMVGTYGDVVVGSFGRDKVLDCVNGGFTLVRNQKCSPQSKELKNLVSSRQLFLNLLYPVVTVLIRNLYGFFGLGRVIFYIAKQVGVLRSPIPSPLPVSSALPAEFGQLLKNQMSDLSAQLAHRRQIAQMYFSQLSAWISVLHISERMLTKAACLRVPVFVPDVHAFILFLRSHNIHGSDRWYRSAVDMGTFSFPTVYQAGSCPNAEFLTKHLCNLPTHRAISVAQAEELARLTRSFLSRPEVLLWYKEALQQDIAL